MRLSKNISIVGSGQIGLSSIYDSHIYAVRGEDGVILIDAGSGLGEIELAHHLDDDFPGQSVKAILVTHAHADHAAGARGLAIRFGCQIIAGSLTQQILATADEARSGLERARSSGTYPPTLKLEPTTVSRVVGHGETFRIADIEFCALEVRGHSDDSVCYTAEIDGLNVLFAGDVVFYGGILGVINTPDSGMPGYLSDLPRLAALQIDALLPSHGLFTLRNGQQHIRAALEATARGFLPRQIGQGDLIF